MKSRSRLQRLSSLEESQLWRRLEAFRDDGLVDEIPRLQSAVSITAAQAVHLGRQVCRYLPQYTLHDERHFLNVLAIMDALIPPNMLAAMTPLEVALCILSAYIHDLGLALSRDEWLRLYSEEISPERQRFLQHREQYRSTLDHLEAKFQERGVEAQARANLIESYVLSEFIRKTHTAEDVVGRIDFWLGQIQIAAKTEALFMYRGCNYRHELALLGASHGQEVTWLREQHKQSSGSEEGFCRLVGLSEWVNFALPGMILRLADIMDFDASRAPALLFDHIGIDEDVSVLEWRKHMSVQGWDLRADEERQYLRYDAESPHPVIERAIRLFGSQIERELQAVQREVTWQRKIVDNPEQQFSLFLPAQVEINVRSQRGYHGPRYIYSELRFELAQESIRALLMGEALYGDPMIALRELLQNSLDAVRLRELRLFLIRLGEGEAELADPLPEAEELSVEVSWGIDEVGGGRVIRVSDSGVGMTRSTVEQYLSRVGKSFYRSPEFVREQSLFRRHGEGMFPISHFGLGFVACFMLADRIRIRTNAGRASGQGAAWDYDIVGPESLFWLRPGTLATQGTEVTLFLKNSYRFASKYSEDPEGDERRSREGIGGIVLDPEAFVRSNLIWPRFPVRLVSHGRRIGVVDSETLTGTIVSSLDPSEWRRRANPWGLDQGYRGELSWSSWEWSDDSGPDSTGSRLRLVYPTIDLTCEQASRKKAPGRDLDVGSLDQEKIAVFAEASLNSTFAYANRTQILIQGIRVRNCDLLWSELNIAHAVGSFLIINLSGDAAPHLTADRSTVINSSPGAEWRAALRGMLNRFAAALRAEGQASSDSRINENVVPGICWRDDWVGADNSRHLQDVVYLVETTEGSGDNDIRTNLHWSLARWLQTLAVQERNGFDRHPDVSQAFVGREREESVEVPGNEENLGLSRFLRVTRPKASMFALSLETLAAKSIMPALGIELARAKNLVEGDILGDMFLEDLRIGSWLQAAFHPFVGNGFPLYKTGGVRVRLEACSRVAPGAFLPEEGRLLNPSKPRPEQLFSLLLGYDLIFPLSDIAHDGLSRTCKEWNKCRELRTLAAGPFLYPELSRIWRRNSSRLRAALGVSEIAALLPGISLWGKAFEEWCPDECKLNCFSALWNLDTGLVHWMRGLATRQEMRARRIVPYEVLRSAEKNL